MNRFFSTLAVLTMALVAMAFWVWQTVEVRENLSDQTTTRLIVLQSVLTLVILAAGASIIRTEYIRRKVSLRQVRSEVVQPLRRLFSTVWS